MSNPTTLDQLRKEIDAMDAEIIDLIAKRRQTVLKIGAYKTEHHLPFYAPDREKEIFEKVENRFGEQKANGYKLLYGILMDLHRYSEYESYPQEISVPSGAGGVSIRAIIADTPFSLCRYLSPLSVADVTVISIHSQPMPGGQLIVDLELAGDVEDPSFSAALSVLSDTSKKFTIL